MIVFIVGVWIDKRVCSYFSKVEYLIYSFDFKVALLCDNV